MIKNIGETYQERYPFGRQPGSSNNSNLTPAGGDNQNRGAPPPTTIEPPRPTEPEKEYQPHPTKMYKTSIQVKAPENFVPQAITEKEKEPEPLPPVVPPKPFKDTRVFENVDTHAVEVREN